MNEVNVEKNDLVEKSLSVSELVSTLKEIVESSLMVVDVEGEIGNFSQSSTGHFYFSLMDSDSSISCCLFRGEALKVSALKSLADGKKIKIKASVSVYSKKCQVQLIVKSLQLLDEIGLLKIKFEKLKSKLSQDGLFDLQKKKVIPKYPIKMAILTSLGAAALLDILNILKRRSLFYDVLVFPCLVQGDSAPKSMIETLDKCYKYHRTHPFDILLITRGGGSYEDLWCFNDESFIRKLAQAPMPVLSAVGHQQDFTLADFVADRRAETPSAAAELLSENQMKIHEGLRFYDQILKQFSMRILSLIEKTLHDYHPQTVLQGILKNLAKYVQRFNTIKIGENILLRKLSDHKIFIEDYFRRHETFLEKIINIFKQRLERNDGLINGLNPLQVLNRGFAIVRTRDSILTSVSSINSLEKDTILNIQFHDGTWEFKK